MQVEASEIVASEVVEAFEALLPAGNWWTPAVCEQVSRFLDEHQELESLLAQALAVGYGDEVSPLLPAKLATAGIKPWHVSAAGYWELQAKKRNFRAWRYRRRSLRYQGPMVPMRERLPHRPHRGRPGCRSRSSSRARARSPGRLADDPDLEPSRRTAAPEERVVVGAPA